jgi:hypothetical protein
MPTPRNIPLPIKHAFRIVIIPGYFSNKSAQKEIDFSDYQAVVRAYHIEESDVKPLNN